MIDQILLGSGSPRRKSLLEKLRLPFRQISSNIDETLQSEWAINDVAENLARLKAISLENQRLPNEVLLCADTIVCMGDEIFGKPQNSMEAAQILKLLSGQTHQVITGIYLKDHQTEVIKSVFTEVEFFKFSSEQISFYLKNYEVLDKAGAYAIQEWIGLSAIKAIRGCYQNVVGLPTANLFQVLAENWSNILPHNP